MKNKRSVSLLVLTSLTLILSQGCGDLDLSGIGVQLPGQDVTAQWQSPASYSRTPTGTNPVNPITLSVDFSDQSGCPNKTYRFWLFSKDGGTPLTGIGSNAELLPTNHFEQVVSLPIDVPVYQVRLACTKANGERYANSDILESGSPAFTPRSAVSWQNPEGYSRLPTGTTPTNPITLSVDFSDENGCPYQLYRFWAYALDGSPVGPIGSIMTLTPGSGVTTSATLPANVPIHAVRLACVDNEGNQYEDTANLEVGNPAFTPTSSGTCSGHNATLCAAPTTPSTCTTCGGTWGNCVESATPQVLIPTELYGYEFKQYHTYQLDFNQTSACAQGLHTGLLIAGNGNWDWWVATPSTPCHPNESSLYTVNFTPTSSTDHGTTVYAITYTTPVVQAYYGTGASYDPQWNTYYPGSTDPLEVYDYLSSNPYWTVAAASQPLNCPTINSPGTCIDNCEWIGDSSGCSQISVNCTSPQTQETCTTCGGTWTTP